MKKSLKTIIILAVVIVVLGGTIGGIAIYANKNNDNSVPDASLKVWMSYLKDDTKMKEIVIPGAHDAGTKGMIYAGKTQDRSVKDQLECGVRYIDLRVGFNKDKLEIYHGPIWGTEFQTVINDVKTFMQENPSEVVLVDLQHFKSDSKTATIKTVEETFQGMMVETEEDEIEFVEKVTLGECRGKCFVFVGEDEEEEESKKPWLFKRNNDEGTVQNAALQSYYNSKYNGGDYKKYVSTALPAYINMYKENGKGFFVLQGQLTDLLVVFGPKFKETQFDSRISAYIDGLKTSDDLQYINIIIRDFITPKKATDILELNAYKKFVKVEKEEEFILNFSK